MRGTDRGIDSRTGAAVKTQVASVASAEARIARAVVGAVVHAAVGSSGVPEVDSGRAASRGRVLREGIGGTVSPDDGGATGVDGLIVGIDWQR